MPTPLAITVSAEVRLQPVEYRDVVLGCGEAQECLGRREAISESLGLAGPTRLALWVGDQEGRGDPAQLVVEGLTNSQIAERLVLSVRTVVTHLYRAMRKLGISDRRDL